MISIFVSHRMLIRWHSTDKPTVVHREDRANTPVFNRLDISSARIKTQIPVFLTLQGHEVPQNQRKRTAFFLGSDLTSRTEVTPNQTVLKSATSWSIMDVITCPTGGQVRECKNLETQLMETYLFCQNPW